LKGNEAIVIEAVKRDGRALEFASNELKNNAKVVKEAVKRTPEAILYAS